MRDIERIDRFCNILADIWKTEFPDLRFGQLIENIQGWSSRDLYYLEENEFLQLLQEYILYYKALSNKYEY